MSEITVAITCPKCGTENRVHQPAVIRVDNGFISQVTLVPTWSPEERICKGCGRALVPVIGEQIPFTWASMEKPAAEEKRIVEATLQSVPRLQDFQRKLGMKIN